MKRIICITVNIIVFIVLRYLSVLCAFLGGMGASDHYKYEIYIYIPATIIQLLFILYKIITQQKEGGYLNKYNYAWTLLVIILLIVFTQLNIIPYSIIPH